MHNLDFSQPFSTTPKANSAYKFLSHSLTLFFFTLLFLLFAHPVQANKTSILIITNDHLKIHKQVGTLLKKELQKKENILVETYHYQSISKEQVLRSSPSLIITLGVNALKLAPPSSIPTIHSLIPRNTLHNKDFCQLEACPEQPVIFSNTYSIYLDHSLKRQLNFISLLLPSAKKIGVLTAPFSINKLKTLTFEATKLDLTIESRHINSDLELSKQLTKLIKNIDVLFTLPDQLIHNSSNIPYLLLSTYRYNIPVIGFSKTYVTAGAVAAIYSAPEQITRQVAELSTRVINSPKTINSHHFSPKYFNIAINNNVANSLELHLPDVQIIKSQLLQLEK